MKDNANLLPTLAVLGAVVLWGSSFSAMKSVLDVLDPMAAMWCRMAVAVAVLAALRRQISFSGYRKGDWLRLGFMALCLPCLYFLLEANALTLTTSAQAGVVSASLPLMVALGGWAMLGERMRPRAAAGLVLAIGSVAWLTLASAPQQSAANPLLGNLLEAGAMVCSAGYMLYARSLSTRYSPLTLTAVQMFAGFLFFTPGAFRLELPEANLAATAMKLLYLGSFVSLGAFGLFNYGVSRIPAGRASAFINMVPVVAVALGWGLLGEALNPVQCLAACGVLLGVCLSQERGENPAEDSEEAPERVKGEA